MLSSHGGFLINAMYHHRETILIKLTHYDETKKGLHSTPGADILAYIDVDNQIQGGDILPQVGTVH